MGYLVRGRRIDPNRVKAVPHAGHGLMAFRISEGLNRRVQARIELIRTWPAPPKHPEFIESDVAASVVEERTLLPLLDRERQAHAAGKIRRIDDPRPAAARDKSPADGGG